MTWFLALLWAGCSDHRSFTTTDSWYKPPPKQHRFLEAQLTGKDPVYQIHPNDIHQVHPSREAAAEKLLENTQCTELIVEKAGDLTGKAVTFPPGSKPFLVRAVALNRGTGTFMAYVVEDQLLVLHGCLGRRPVPMTRQALVLPLYRIPQEVFVSCTMAE